MSSKSLPSILIGNNTNQVLISSRESRRKAERANKKSLKKGGAK
jgi:hypothetical protein